MSNFYEQMSPASMETQSHPIQRGRQGGESSLSPPPTNANQDSNSRQPSYNNLDDVSITATTGGDSPTPESLQTPIDPSQFSEDESEASPTPDKSKASMTDKIQGKIQMTAGKITKNTELYERGEVRQSGQSEEEL